MQSSHCDWFQTTYLCSLKCDDRLSQCHHAISSFAVVFAPRFNRCNPVKRQVFNKRIGVFVCTTQCFRNNLLRDLGWELSRDCLQSLTTEEPTISVSHYDSRRSESLMDGKFTIKICEEPPNKNGTISKNQNKI